MEETNSEFLDCSSFDFFWACLNFLYVRLIVVNFLFHSGVLVEELFKSCPFCEYMCFI